MTIAQWLLELETYTQDELDEATLNTALNLARTLSNKLALEGRKAQIKYILAANA